MMKTKKLFFLMLFALLTFSVGWANNVYVKVTSADQLVPGKKYIFVHAYEDVPQFEVAGALGNMGFSATYYYNNNNISNFTSVGYDAVDISNLTKVSELTLDGESGAWTFQMSDGSYIKGPDTESGYKITTTETIDQQSQWIIENSEGGYIVKNAKFINSIILQRSKSGSFRCEKMKTTYFPSYLYVQAGESSLNAPESLDISEDLTLSFTLTGENLLNNLTVTSSNEDFTVTPSTITLNDNRGVNSEITVTYTGTDTNASTIITITNGNISKEVQVTATLPVSILEVSTNTLDLGLNPSGTFTVNGSNLTNDVSITQKAGSDDGFTINPTSIAANNGTVNNAEITVSYRGAKANATATIVLTSGDLTQEVVVNANAEITATPETLDLGYNPTGTFTVGGKNLASDITVYVKDGSDVGFSVNPSRITPTDGIVNNTEVTVAYSGTIRNASAVIVVSSGDLTKEVTITAKLPEPSIEVSTNTLAMGTNPNGSFTVDGENLENDVTVALKDGSDDGFSFKPSNIAITDGKVNNAEVSVFYCGSKANATATIVLTSGDLTQEVTVTASAPTLFTTAGNYYISNTATGKYVVLENSQLATVTAEGDYDADVIVIGFDANGHISEMRQQNGEGDMIATLNMIKNSMKEVLQDNNMPYGFLDQMFSMRMVKTGDSDGSVYLCVDVPYIENFDIIKAQLLAQSGGYQAINYYLGNMTDGMRHYLCVDSDNSFGLSLDNGAASKWMLEEYVVVDDDLFTTPGNYFVSNKGNNKYVVINGEYDAAASAANTDEADIIILGFNSDGTVMMMKNYDGEGDIIETLETVKSVMKNKLQGQDGIDASFVDDMFKIKLVKTNDGDGSMYFCFDIPNDENVTKAHDYLVSNGGINNQLVKDYLDILLQPGKRIYLCTADENGTFSFTKNRHLDATKWMVEEFVIPEDDLFTTPGNYYVSNKGNSKYVVINGAYDAAASAANTEEADIIKIAFNADGIVTMMKNYDGDGDLIATLETVKSVLKSKLEENDMDASFVDKMFDIKLVKTGDSDGSIYFCFDVPRFKNASAIRDYLLTQAINNQLVKDYLDILLQPGKRVYLCTADENGTFSFTLDGSTNASKWMVEESEIQDDIPFTTNGDYYINSKWTGKYVKLENSQLATVTAENKAQADIITMAFNDDGTVTTMKQKNGEGDMIATLNIIKNSMKEVLQDNNMPYDFLDQMFTLKMLMTRDGDGSVYLVVDVPEIENFDEIRAYLIANSGDNQAVNFYLSNMQSGNRHYLCVDDDQATFGLTLDNGLASKWMAEPVKTDPEGGILFTDAWYYYIQNKQTGKYVELVNSMLADVKAETEDDADVIKLGFDDDGYINVMEQYMGDGDMIATLNMIKNSMKEVLQDNNMPYDFLDQMFTMKMIYTGDDDGSVYLVVDVPEIDNWNAIKDYLISQSGNNQAINFYLSHMVPGNRHYLCADADDTFGFTLDNGTASKWLVYRLEVIPIDEEHFPDQYFREFVHAKYDKNDNWWLSQAELDAVTSMDIRVSDNADYANITDLTGIEWFTNLKKFFFAGTSSNKLIVEELDMSNLVNLEEFTCRYASNLTEVNVSGCTNLKYIQLMYDDAIAGVDLTNNTNMVEIDIENCNAFSELTIPTLPLLESFTLRNCDAFKNQTIDLTNDNNLYVLSLAGGVRNNLIKGVSKDMTNLRYISADYNNFEDDVLDLTGCQYLFNLSLVNCGLRELLLNGCTNLGTRQKSRPNKPEQDGSLTIHSNYLRALDLSGVTGDIDETAPRNYNYNLSSNYPDLFPASNYIMHSGYNGQITTKVKPDVSYWRYIVEGNNITYSYLVYLRLDGTQSEETEGSFVNSLMEVGPTNYIVDRVNQWVRFESGHGNPEDIIVEKDVLELVRGNKRTISGISSRDIETELDPDKIPGDILSLGIYTVPKGAGEQTVSGKIAYLYNVKQDVDPESVQVVNPDEQLDTQTKIRDYYVSNALTEDGDNLFPFEVEWEIVLSDKPEEIITAIDTLMLNKEVSKVTYVNLMGVESDRPFEGVNIVVTHYTDGSVTTTKEIR
ncbi:MAG: hypothetical protein J6X22_01970 [Muribaculaceae bacterium]|nr:hypothetical protein [Muribaculaceae bacterium]